MGIIIPFDKNRKKAKKSCPSGSCVQGKYLTDEELAERNLKMDQQFYYKYHDILAAAPELPALKIKYLSEIMLCIAPYMFTEGWDTRFFALMDFEDMFSLELYTAVSEYKEANSIPDETDSFSFRQLPYDRLEEELCACLKTLISLIPEDNTGNSSRIIQQTVCLFGIYHSISYMFDDELETRIRQGLPQLNCYDREKWIPPFLANWHINQ